MVLTKSVSSNCTVIDTVEEILMADNSTRIEEEKETVEKMIRYYCQHKHSLSTNELCQDCSNLLTYSHKRLDICQFGEEKPTCRKCPVHCYSPTNRAKIRAVMRYAGPRLMFRAPLNWIKHKLRER
jgi:hypothetical protein